MEFPGEDGYVPTAFEDGETLTKVTARLAKDGLEECEPTDPDRVILLAERVLSDS